MRSKTGIEIKNICQNSMFEKAGLRAGDILLSINSKPLHDVIDFMFHKTSNTFDIEFKRNGTKTTVQSISGNERDPGLTFKPLNVITCKNNCIFCFVKQLPKGLRKSLYVKDEDYRLSFLYGNYITISNLDTKERKRIVEQRLSPLYISVHTTNRSLRNKMLGNPRASDITKELKFFADNKIRMHTQIVLCPHYNDRKELRNTIRDIYKYYPYTSSIAVVPVGLTRHKKIHIDPVLKDDAINAIEIVESFQKRFKKKHGDPIVYCADEMYIKAGHPLPKLKEYGSLPQIENGVGMVPLFTNQSKKIKIPRSISKKKRFITFTGTSFYPFLKKFIDRLSDKENIKIDLIPVENIFFGSSVTVAGLLTGRDIIRALNDISDSYDILIVPDAPLKEDEDIFIDNVSLRDIEEALEVRTIKSEATPHGLLDAMTDI